MAERRRPMFHLPDGHMAHYDALQDEEDGVRLETSRKHQHEIVGWLWGNYLFRDAFLPGRVYGFEGDEATASEPIIT